MIAFGKGDEGQLGLREKRFVSAPIKSKVLSSNSKLIAAVCAVSNYSFTLDETGDILSETGKCKRELLAQEFAICRQRAADQGLLKRQRE